MNEKYDIKERVGKGSFGQVYNNTDLKVFRAVEKASGRIVAIKLIDLEGQS